MQKIIKEQIDASNPQSNVWVTANAGSGKTSVLTSRFIRLMLAGSPAEKILCITFTNAGAAEMKEKLFERLSKISFASDSEKKLQLEGILGRKATDADCVQIQKIYLKIIDRPDKIKIQTIHALCQSILKKFPIEAAIQPYFSVIDEITKGELIDESFSRLFAFNFDFYNQKSKKYTDEITASLKYLAANYTDFTIKNGIKAVLAKANKFFEVINKFEDVFEFNKNLYKKLNADFIEADLIKSFFEENKNDLKFIADEFAKGPKTTTDSANLIYSYLREYNFDALLKAFLTAKGEPSKFGHIKIVKESPLIANAIAKIQQNILAFEDSLVSKNLAQTTEAICYLAYGVIQIYESLKQQRACLDYDDLIFKTTELLTNKAAADWVLFKLDGGLQHILVDEAQDTSKAQWQIIGALTNEFFSSETNRTLFVVGDEKQSIFGFQGADIENFYAQRKKYLNITNGLDNSLEIIPFTKSFRTLQYLLDVVDKVFEGDLKQHISDNNTAITHISERKDAKLGGYFELVKPIGEKKEKQNNKEQITWFLPESYPEDEDLSNRKKLAQEITSKIKNWLDNKRILPATNQPIKPSDIMILVQSRDELHDELCRQLQATNIKISGVNKQKLSENIVAQDLLAFAKFLVLQSDDYNFACLLKSPIFNFSEDDLFELAYDRGAKSLFQKMLESPSKYLKQTEFLKYFLNQVDFKTVSQIITEMLDVSDVRQNFYKRFGKDCKVILNEFLNYAQTYEASYNAGMQGFISWFSNADIEIKTASSNAPDEVRILTVHGSKGLEAPIVILANAAQDKSKSKKMPQVLFYEDFFVSPILADLKNNMVQVSLDKISAQESSEYLRLLYVALTRARDEVYVYGAVDYAEKQELWYNIIKNALQKFENINSENENLVLSTPEYIQKMHADTETLTTEAAEINFDKYKYLNQKLDENNIFNNSTKIYSPSELNDNENSAFEFTSSDKKHEGFAGGESDFERGKILHKLFENLPKIEKSKQQQFAKNIFEKSQFSSSLNFEEIFSEAEKTINNPIFNDIFFGKTLSEVPIIGEFEGKFYSGKIDKLVFYEDELLILDFKTNRQTSNNSPNQKTIKKYKIQLGAYKNLLQKIYPQKNIKTAILWSVKNSLEFLD
jgi:ATP-dependent helicase/nuclease subunit A